MLNRTETEIVALVLKLNKTATCKITSRISENNIRGLFVKISKLFSYIIYCIFLFLYYIISLTADSNIIIFIYWMKYYYFTNNFTYCYITNHFVQLYIKIFRLCVSKIVSTIFSSSKLYATNFAEKTINIRYREQGIINCIKRTFFPNLSLVLVHDIIIIITINAWLSA